VPFVGEDFKELENKICTSKCPQMPNNINFSLRSIINKLLQKKPEQRPTIEEIIMMPEIQQKCQLLRIPLPQKVNVAKLEKKEKLKLPETPTAKENVKEEADKTTPRGNASTNEDTSNEKRLSAGIKTPKTGLSQVRLQNRALQGSSSQPELIQRRITPRADSKTSKLSGEEKLRSSQMLGGTGNPFTLSKMLLPTADAIPEHNPKKYEPGQTKA
jgi:serine/threonine protein kinase